MSTWQSHLTESELKEIEFCQFPLLHIAHRTDAYSLSLIVAKLVKLLEEQDSNHEISPTPASPSAHIATSLAAL